MNLLLLLPQEICSESLAVVSGARARELIVMHDLRENISIQAGVLGGKRGRAHIQKIEAEKLKLAIQFDQPEIPRSNCSLIVGACRPQTTKRILEFAACAGVQALHLIRSAQSDKNYLSSNVLKPERRLKHLIKGLEQAADTIAPDVQIHYSFKAFVEQLNSNQLGFKTQESNLFLGDTGSDVLSLSELPESGRSADKHSVLAIGPESGFSDFEIQALQQAGFQSVSLGKRQFRIEQALVMLFAQSRPELLRAMS